MERYNDNPIALSEGKVFVDGVQILDGVKFELNLHLMCIPERYWENVPQAHAGWDIQLRELSQEEYQLHGIKR